MKITQKIGIGLVGLGILYPILTQVTTPNPKIEPGKGTTFGVSPIQIFGGRFNIPFIAILVGVGFIVFGGLKK